jgi:membrane-associated phospholipid phosphatase
MRLPNRPSLCAILAIAALSPGAAFAQTATNLEALRGLVPVSVLGATTAGKAALASDESVTAAIQEGSAKQPTLLPFVQQQQQALRDAFITSGNGTELADGLGSRLGGVYQSLTAYSSPDDGTTKTFKNVAPSVANLFAYTSGLTSSDAGSGKFFFSNGTLNGKKPVSAAATAIMTAAGGVTDIFGSSTGHPIGSSGADPFGDSRPFQTEPSLTPIKGPDFFGVVATNHDYLYGPIQNLTTNPSFPSGHTTYGYTESLVLAFMVPTRYSQQITRAAEYGNDRIVLGAHYAMDVIAGRTLALHDVAQMLANKLDYVDATLKGSKPIADYPAAVTAARADFDAALQPGCKMAVPACASEDTGRFANPAANEAFYESTQTYGLPVVYPKTAAMVEDVGKIAPEAGYLLTIAFPSLTLSQADDILTATEGPGGGFLDNGSAFGLYSRLDLFKAVQKAAAP